MRFNEFNTVHIPETLLNKKLATKLTYRDKFVYLIISALETKYGRFRTSHKELVQISSMCEKSMRDSLQKLKSSKLISIYHLKDSPLLSISTKINKKTCKQIENTKIIEKKENTFSFLKFKNKENS